MFSRLTVWLLFAATIVSPTLAAERNAWPFWVGQEDDVTGEIISEQVLGPLYASQVNPDGSTQQALRPFWLKTAQEEKTTHYFLYPFFTYHRSANDSSFTFLQLINGQHDTSADSGDTRRFDLWPLYFSRDTGNPDTSYHALFPVFGTVKNRFGKDRLTWVLFPLYFNTEKAGKQTTTLAWPFIRIISGAEHHGFELWPLFGRREHPGDYHNQFYLWPFFYKYESHLSAAQPDVNLGILPFYAHDTGPGYENKTYAWPFFGFSHRTLPEKYDETRYFWPFFVQGRGDQRYVNRYGPFYTHSVIKGYDKTWLLWPLLRQARWSEGDVAQEKDTVLFFVYSSVKQHSLTNPLAAPAYKRHFWPLLSIWDNGAGQRQAQFLSPLELFFPNNEPIRRLYSPLFALYRLDQRTPLDIKHTLLWNLVSWRRSPAETEFHFGPLGWRRAADAPHGRLFFFASASASATKASVPSTP